jgi:hypothetical protein
MAHRLITRRLDRRTRSDVRAESTLPRKTGLNAASRQPSPGDLRGRIPVTGIPSDRPANPGTRQIFHRCVICPVLGRTLRALIIVNGTSTLSFKTDDNLQIVNL